MLELGAVEVDELIEVGEVEQTSHLVDLFRRRAEAQLESAEHCVRHGARDLESDDVAETSALELELDGLEQVVGLVRDLEVRVARHAERRALDDLHPGEELGRKCEITSSSGTNRSSAASGTKRGRRSGTLTRANRSSPVSPSRASTPRESERPEMYGNGCPGPTPSGVRTGNISRANRRSSSDRFLARERVDGGDRDARLVERRTELLPPELRLGVDELDDPLSDRRERLARGQAVDGADGEPRRRLPDEPGDADHEELVEVRRAEAAHAHPLEQGERVVGRELEQPCVVLDRRELAVEQTTSRLRLACRRHRLIFAAEGLSGGYELVSIW